jgi:hypothetical protein
MGTPEDNTAPGRGDPGGRAHASISSVVLGHFTGIDFLSEDPRALGAWVLDESGAPVIKGTEPRITNDICQLSHVPTTPVAAINPTTAARARPRTPTSSPSAKA